MKSTTSKKMVLYSNMNTLSNVYFDFYFDTKALNTFLNKMRQIMTINL
jgi:hypothetical protein